MIVYSSVLLAIFITTLLNTVSSQLSIVSANTLSAGEPLTVTCDASRVPITESNITMLAIYRKVADDSKFYAVADYEYNRGESTFKVIPSGRNWNFTFAGINKGLNNRDTMKVQFIIYDTTCYDSGLYRCQVTYSYGDGLKKDVNATDQNVTIVSIMRNVALKVEPKNAEPTENLTITCTADGNQNLQLFWKSVVSNKTETDVTSGITSEAPILLKDSDCVENRHTSLLKMAAASITELTMFTCVGKYIGQEVGRKSIYIDKFGASNRLPILSTYTATFGGTFSATCDASHVLITEKDVDFVSELAILRTVPEEIDSEVAEYKSYPFGSSLSKPVVPRDWTVTGVGYNQSVDNVDSMKLELLVKDVMCEDAGTYTCFVKYSYNNGTEKSISATDQKLTVKPTARNLVLKADPNSTATLPRYGEYDLNEDITINCSVDGLQSLKLEWKSQVNGTVKNVTSGITSSSPVLISNSYCVEEYRHSTTLKVKILNRTMYICIVTNSVGQELGTDHFIIGPYSGCTVHGPNVGLLVSIVIVLLAYFARNN